MRNTKDIVSNVDQKIETLNKFRSDILKLEEIITSNEIYKSVAYIYKPTKHYIFYVGPNYHMGNWSNVEASFLLFNATEYYDRTVSDTILNVKLEEVDDFIKENMIIKNDFSTILYRELEV